MNTKLLITSLFICLSGIMSLNAQNYGEFDWISPAETTYPHAQLYKSMKGKWKANTTGLDESYKVRFREIVRKMSGAIQSESNTTSFIDSCKISENQLVSLYPGKSDLDETFPSLNLSERGYGKK